MASNKKKGAVLASVVVLMVIVIAISMLVFALTLGASISNKYENSKLAKEVTTNKLYADFVDNQIINDEYDEFLDIQIYVSDDNSNIKAVVAKNKNAIAKNLYFYCIYDFSQNKVLAKQSQDFYLTKKIYNGVEYYYLADIVRYVEV